MGTKPSILAWTGAFLLVGAGALCPFFVNVEESYAIYFLFLTYVHVGLAQGWNLVAGYAGQASLGQHSIFGVGAYLTARTWKAGWTGYLDPLAMSLSGAGAAIPCTIGSTPAVSNSSSLAT